MTTLVDVMRARAAHEPDRTAYVYLTDGEVEERRLSYRELEAHAMAIAGLLQERGVRQGDRVILLFPPSLDYVVAFYGCLFAGAIAVPAYPPRSNGPTARLDAIAKDAQASMALTTNDILTGAQRSSDGLDTRSWLATDELDRSAANAWRMPTLTRDTLAFLQYTSGSTSTPKGVMVSHGNLMANERMLQVALEQDRESTWVGWLPMFHDMGLIGNVIQPLYVGAPSILMSPMAFIQKPIRWLRAITNYKARTSGAPNFAYDLCVAKTTPEERQGLDLSSWSLAFNGSEPVRHDTLARFTSTFQPFGFRSTTFYPCYGLAEATLLVSGPLKSAAPRVQAFDAAGLEQHRAIPAVSDAAARRLLVGCGRSWLDQTITVVDPETSQRCPDGQVGEIWVSGPNVAQGYWGRPDATEASFRGQLAGGGDGRYLRTGDLGFFHEGDLFISGRIKDLIIIRGRNHFPQDVERTVESSHEILRPGCGAAFSIDVEGDERLAVVYEVKRGFKNVNLDDVAVAIRQAVLSEHELATQAVVLIKPASIPKTSSGKIQRHACRQMFLGNAFDPVLVSVALEAPARAAMATSDGQAALLRQTLGLLGVDTGRALLQSHLRERAGEVRPNPVEGGPLGALGVWDSEARDRFRRLLETDLGISIPEELVLGASNPDALASDLLALVTEQERT